MRLPRALTRAVPVVVLMLVAAGLVACSSGSDSPESSATTSAAGAEGQVASKGTVGDDTASFVVQPKRCKDASVADKSCSKSDATTLQEVHCGDERYATLKASPLMQQNLQADPVNGADVCSFGSNRIRVFNPSTGKDLSALSCLGQPQNWIVPPGAGKVVVQAWGASGGNTTDSSGRPFSALGGFGGFAEFDGAAHGSHGTPVALQPGDVLQVVVGCKPPATGTPNGSGDRSAGPGGGSTAVLWIGETDPAVGDKISTDSDRYQAAMSQAKKDGLVDSKGRPVLVVAGGGGGAARDAFGGDGQIGGGAHSYPSGDGFVDHGTVGHGANHNGDGAGGAGSNAGGNGLQGTGGDGYGGGPGGVGFNTGGQGGYGAWPGGGGGGGYGGGGSGSSDVPGKGRTCNNCDSGGGGGGGSVSWGGDPTQSTPLDQDGFVSITWQPDTLGGADCTYQCRAVFATCTLAGSSAGGGSPAYKLPSYAGGASFFAIGAAGGGTIDDHGATTLGGSGGFAGGGGAKGLDQDQYWAAVVGCPGTWSKTADLGGGGGGSSALITTDGGPAGLVEVGSSLAIAGGGGGAAVGSAGGDGGVTGRSDAANAKGGDAPGNPGGDGGGGGSDNQSGGHGYGRGGDGGDGPGGNGGDGGGRGLPGNYGGAGGAGPDGESKDGYGGNGDHMQYNGVPYGAGGGGGGLGGGGGGGLITNADDSFRSAGGGGGGGSFTSKQYLAPAPPSANSTVADLFMVWNGLAGALPGELGMAAKLIGGVAQGVRAAVEAAPGAQAALKAPERSPLAFGLIVVRWSCDRDDATGKDKYTCLGGGMKSSRSSR